MNRGPAVAVVLLVVLVALAVPVEAHAPEFPEGGDSLEKATEVKDPTKSWAIYSHLHEGGEAHYYLLRMRQGENITVSLIAPRHSTDNGFLPSMVLMGPGIEGAGAPSFVQVPIGAGAEVIAGSLPPGMEYEPFSPSAFYELGNVSLEAPQDGDYYLAVYDETTGGSYGLAVGLRESFTAEEWVLVPFSALSIYLWEGQSPPAVLLAPAAAIAVGLAAMLALPRRSRPLDVLWVLATAAGLLMVASGVSLAYQMLWSLSQTGAELTLAVTIVLAAVPLALGSAALRIAGRGRDGRAVSAGTRIAMAAVGVLGLLLWGGWIIGPAIAIAAAVLPSPVLTRVLGGPGRRAEVR